MRWVKPRKKRGIKKDGTRSMDMCSGCLSFGCDPFADSPAWRDKKRRRSAAGQCLSCGSNPCKCKSDGGLRVPEMRVGKKCQLKN